MSSSFCPSLSPSWTNAGLVISLSTRTGSAPLRPAGSRACSASETESGPRAAPRSGPLLHWSLAESQRETHTQSSLATCFTLSDRPGRENETPDLYHFNCSQPASSSLRCLQHGRPAGGGIMPLSVWRCTKATWLQTIKCCSEERLTLFEVIFSLIQARDTFINGALSCSSDLFENICCWYKLHFLQFAA